MESTVSGDSRARTSTSRPSRGTEPDILLPSPEYEAVLQPMPRRMPLAKLDPARAALRVRSAEPPRPRLLFVLWRAFHWSWVLFVFALKLLKDRISKNTSLQRRGQRIRQMFESMGGTGIKIGQQMS